jgi:uncharacterized membrane protein (DUF2068 family)
MLNAVPVSKRKSGNESSDPWLILIGLFKLLKAAGLLVLGFGLLHLLHRDVAALTTHWIERFRLDPDNEHIHRILSRIFRVTPKQLRELSAGTFIYAGIFLVEGTGLLLRKHWAEYVTLISTSLFIPLEVYELIHRFTAIRLSVLIINVATVWYLAVRIKNRRR